MPALCAVLAVVVLSLYGGGRVSFRNFRFTPMDTATDISALKQLFAEVENYELFAV